MISVGMFATTLYLFINVPVIWQSSSVNTMSIIKKRQTVWTKPFKSKKKIEILGLMVAEIRLINPKLE